MRLVITMSLLLLTAATSAQVYTWRDASGKIHYADQPPTDRGAVVRKLGPARSESADAAPATQAADERRAEAARARSEEKEKAAESEKRRAEDAQRQLACERARTNLQGLESGQIRFRLRPDGEREALDGAVREAELAEARRAVEINCSPRPPATATKK